MSSQGLRDLERRAIEANQRGEPWPHFFSRNTSDIRATEPWNAERYRQLCSRLLHLVLCGDGDGMEPPPLEPWTSDDASIEA